MVSPEAAVAAGVLAAIRARFDDVNVLASAGAGMATMMEVCRSGRQPGIYRRRHRYSTTSPRRQYALPFQTAIILRKPSALVATSISMLKKRCTNAAHRRAGRGGGDGITQLVEKRHILRRQLRRIGLMGGYGIFSSPKTAPARRRGLWSVLRHQRVRIFIHLAQRHIDDGNEQRLVRRVNLRDGGVVISWQAVGAAVEMAVCTSSRAADIAVEVELQ